MNECLGGNHNVLDTGDRTTERQTGPLTCLVESILQSCILSLSSNRNTTVEIV